MDKKMFALLIVIVMIVAAFAGCSGDSKKPGGGPKPTETQGAIETQTGWLQAGEDGDTDDKGPYTPLHQSFIVELNGTEITEASFTIRFEDYDDSHSGTDGNSPPDDIEVTIRGGNQTGQGSGTTPCSVSINFRGNKTSEGQELLPREWEIEVTGKCYCETVYPPSGRPSLIITYTRDQGVSYSLDGNFKYYMYE